MKHIEVAGITLENPDFTQFGHNWAWTPRSTKKAGLGGKNPQ